MFIVFWKDRDQCEVIVNTDQISKIEVRYVIKADAQDKYRPVPLEDARRQPEARRVYTIFVAGEEFKVIPDNSKAWAIIDEICRNAVRD